VFHERTESRTLRLAPPILAACESKADADTENESCGDSEADEES
jgi:hypothetical protein